MCALCHRDEHDVHYADSSDAEGHCADDSEQKVERGAELHDLGRVGDGVPAGNRFVVFGIEVVAVRQDCAHRLECLEVELGGAGLKDDAVRIALVAEQPEHVERDEGVFVVGTVVGRVLNFVFQDADDLKDVAFDLNRFAYRRVAVEELLRCVRAEDDDLPMVGKVCGLEVSALFDVEFSHAAIGKVDCFALDIDDLWAVLEAEPSSVSELTALRKGTSSRTASVSPSRNFTRLAGSFAAGLHAGLSAPHHDDVVAETEEAV